MDDAGFFPLDRLPSRTALNYMTGKDATNPRTNIYAVPAYGQPDGGSFATVGDMTKFWMALHNRELLEAKTTELVLARHADVTHKTGYAYGIWIDDDWGPKSGPPCQRRRRRCQLRLGGWVGRRRHRNRHQQYRRGSWEDLQIDPRPDSPDVG